MGFIVNYFDEFYGSAILNANLINYTDPLLDGSRHEREHSQPGRQRPRQLDYHMLIICFMLQVNNFDSGAPGPGQFWSPLDGVNH